MSKTTKRLTVSEQKYLGNSCTLGEIIDAARSVPPSLRKSISFETVADGDYGTSGLYINWSRLETDAELDARLDTVNRAKEYRRRQYEALKKEFEG